MLDISHPVAPSRSNAPASKDIVATSIPAPLDVAAFRKAVTDKLRYAVSREAGAARDHDWFLATGARDPRPHRRRVARLDRALGQGRP
jgi:hypothetical protein